MQPDVARIASEAQAKPPVVRLENLHKRFRGAHGEVVALDKIDLEISENSFVSIVGPSGCGKSTILNMAAGLMEPTSGSVFFKGKPVTEVNTSVGYVTQESKLFPWLSVGENVAFPLTVRGYSRAERQRLVTEHLQLVGLDGFEKAYPRQLSGGMQKRASIIRTLIYDPEVVLMDEPFGPLDAQTRMLLQDELLRIWSQRRKTIVFITHDLVEAIALSDVVVVLSNRPSTVRAVIDVPLGRPRNVFEIHQMKGFSETYDVLWRIFRHELHIG